MGVLSNVEVLLSEKHQNDNNNDHEEFFFIIMEEQTKHQEQSHLDDEDDDDDHKNLIQTKHQTVQVQEQQQQKIKNDRNIPDLNLNLNLKIKIPPYNSEEEETEREGSSSLSDNDGFKTPTRTEYTIPPMLECPPAPRKPKTTPSSKAKRKVCYGQRFLHFGEEVFDDYLLFPPTTPSTVDRNKNKKVKVKLFTDE